MQAGAGGPRKDERPRPSRCGHHAEHSGTCLSVRLCRVCLEYIEEVLLLPQFSVQLLCFMQLMHWEPWRDQSNHRHCQHGMWCLRSHLNWSQLCTYFSMPRFLSSRDLGLDRCFQRTWWTEEPNKWEALIRWSILRFNTQFSLFQCMISRM